MSARDSLPSLSGPRRPAILAAVLLLALLGAGCGGEDRKPEARKGEQAAPQAVPVKVLVMRPRTVPMIYDYTGQLEAKESVEIRARVEGFLERIAYVEGGLVKQGDLLFAIDRKPFEEALHQAQGDLSRNQASLDKAKADDARYSALFKQSVVSQEEYDRVRTSYREAQAQAASLTAAVQAARLNLGYCDVTSPITGRAGKAQVKVGSLVGRSESTLLTTVDSVDPIYVNFSISEQEYLSYIRAVQAKHEQADESPPLYLVLADGKEYDQVGRAEIAQRTVDPRTGTLPVRGIFPNPTGMLLPGQFAKVRVKAEDRKDTLLAPQRAIMDTQGRKTVYVAGANNVLEARTVTLGAGLGSFYVIEQGLAAGDKVVVENIQKLRPGMSVDPQEVPQDEVGLLPDAPAASPKG